MGRGRNTSVLVGYTRRPRCKHLRRVSIVAMPVCTTLKENFSTLSEPFPLLIVAHSPDSVTLYCTLSHFSTPFGTIDPAVSTATSGG
jgi:hypothetical protein